MNTLRYLLFKEFRQIFRNKIMLPIIFVIPVVQLVVLTHAATFDIKNLKLYWVDHDQSSFSRRLYGKFDGSVYFKVAGSGFSVTQAEAAMARDAADLVIEIPEGFERKLVREGEATLPLLINAIDGVKAGLATAYSGAVIRDFNQELLAEQGPRLLTPAQLAQLPRGGIELIQQNWFNPELDYKTFMVPGILGLLVTMIGAFLSAMNIVKEKEIGTIEQLNVTPIRKYQFIIGKLLPFWVIALVELAIGLGVAKLVFDIPIEGSLLLIFGFSALYLLVILGFGLFISTVTETQQQAMFVSWFFLVIFILLSGFFTAIENMPEWAQVVTWFNPVRWFMEVIRMVMLKGAGLADITRHIWIVGAYALALNALAGWNYRKTV